MLPTHPIPVGVAQPPIAELYHISYAYYSCLGFTVTYVIGILVSFVTGKID